MSFPVVSRLRFPAVVALLAAAALFLHSRSFAEELPPRTPVSAFPEQVDGWQGHDVALVPEVLEVLGEGEFLQRLYVRADDEPFVDFFLAFFPSQRTGQTIHSPKNCLPGAGWAPLESTQVSLTWPDGRSFPVNQYIIGRGLDRQVVLYWYQGHGRAIASEYWAKFYLVADAVRLNRSDGALVRVISPVGPGESLDQANTRAIAFAHQLLPLLDNHIPR